MLEETTELTFGEVPAGKCAMAVLGKVGDTKIIWDASKQPEVQAARAQYDLLTGKGYAAFHVKGKDGERGEQMREFNPNAERIIFVPQMQGG